MIDRVEVAIVVDNFCDRSGFKAEHGLSLLFDFRVDGERHRILLDAGQTEGVFMGNLKALSWDSPNPRAVVISHGHYDHTGGLLPFLNALPRPVPVVIHPEAWGPRLMIKPFLRNVGMRFSASDVSGTGSWVIPASGPIPICPGVHTSGTIPRREPTEAHTPFSRIVNGALVEDPIMDDTALVFDLGEKGVIVATGCCHAGVVNTVTQALKLTGRQKLKALIGGLHLSDVGPERLARTVAFLKEKNVERVIPLHCTGRREIYALLELLGDKVRLGGAGDVIVLAE
ncbi:MAG: MBL fold metallo-hydrolase [Pseudomonadota bacterium]